MNPKKLSVLKKATILDVPYQGSRILKEIESGEVLSYTDIKRRDHISWYEVILPDGQKGYIEKEYGFPWEKVKIKSEKAFFRTSETDSSSKIDLPLNTVVHIIAPHFKKVGPYTIVNQEGIEGKMARKIEIESEGWVWFKGLFIAIFLVLMIVSFLFLLEAGYIVVSGLLVLILGGVAIGVAFVTLILVLMIKTMFSEVKSRF